MFVPFFFCNTSHTHEKEKHTHPITHVSQVFALHPPARPARRVRGGVRAPRDGTVPRERQRVHVPPKLGRRAAVDDQG